MQKVADANVALTVEAIKAQSEVLAGMVAAGELVIVGAMHDVATGQITLIS